MEDFFSGNGYDIVDKTHTQRNYFDNIWVFVMKICTIAIGVMNKEAKENKPSLIIL
jgi:hypothetical protein